MLSNSIKRCSFSFTGGPVSHEVLNRCASTVVSELQNRSIECLGLSRGITPILNGFGEQSVQMLTSERIAGCVESNESVLATERFLPRRKPFELQSVIRFLLARNVNWDIATGGDGTFITKLALSRANRQLRRTRSALQRIVQIPRTMDGDFINEHYDLGFATALHHGVKSLKAFAGDSSIYGGPCITKMMGRDSGRFALHCAAQFHADLCLVPEEFSRESVDHLALIDALVARVLFGVVCEKRFPQILVAEGFWQSLRRESQELLGLERCGADEHFRIDYKSSPSINAAIADAVESRLHELGVMEHGVAIPVLKREVGYAERQGEAIDADLELAQDLGRHAVDLALSSKRGLPDSLVVLPGGEWIAFEDIRNDGDKVLSPELELHDPLFKSALVSQRWLKRTDLEDANLVAQLAAVTSLTDDQFIRHFSAAVDLFAHRS